MNLSDVFPAVAHKTLVAVDLPHAGSNQHELNGVAALREFFRTTRKTEGTINWHYFADDRDPEHGTGKFTFYDARAKSAHRTGRSEWRLYYSGDFLLRARPGDLLVLARTASGAYHALVFQKDSSWLRAARELLGLTELQRRFRWIPSERLERHSLEFFRQRILDELELGLGLPASSDDEALVVERFGHAFPSTREMSALARSLAEADLRDPDATLTRWLHREEQLFRALETVIVRERLQQQFRSVDEFIEYSLSVHNRRKSRMGFALQNHLEELFRLSGLRFSTQVRTERNNTADFIFPGAKEYRDPAFDTALLVMLGAKSTCKDRWRQVLTEAARIPTKHLCTLEAGISTKRTDEMRAHSLRLVIPAGLHCTFTRRQRAWIMTVGGFIDFVRHKQRKLL